MADDANPLDPQSIAELIRRTLESSRPPESSALRQAVAKHAGQPVELEPVVTDLVEASLAEFPASLKRSAALSDQEMRRFIPLSNRQQLQTNLDVGLRLAIDPATAAVAATPLPRRDPQDALRDLLRGS